MFMQHDFNGEWTTRPVSRKKTHHSLPQIVRKARTADVYENKTAIGGQGGEANDFYIDCDIDI